MTWIGLATPRNQRFSIHGIGIDHHAEPVVDRKANAIMQQGTILLEIKQGDTDRPEQLLHFNKTGLPSKREFAITSVPGGGLTLIHAHGAELRHTSLMHEVAGRMDVQRVQYTWCMKTGKAQLTVSRPQGRRVFSTAIDDPLPMYLGDVHDMLMSDEKVAGGFVFAAVSTRQEPLGPAPSLGLQAPVATPSGYVPAGQLRRGDTIRSSGGDVIPVLHALRRRVPAAGSFRPIRLRAPYFGLRSDAIVSPTQRLVISGTEVEYTFGTEAVLVSAGHLVNNIAARYEPSGPIVDYTHVLLPSHETLDVAGTHLESLYIGRIRRDRAAIESSIFRDLALQTLPEHAHPVHPVLGAFEAITLADLRAA